MAATQLPPLLPDRPHSERIILNSAATASTPRPNSRLIVAALQDIVRGLVLFPILEHLCEQLFHVLREVLLVEMRAPDSQTYVSAARSSTFPNQARWVASLQMPK